MSSLRITSAWLQSSNGEGLERILTASPARGGGYSGEPVGGLDGDGRPGLAAPGRAEPTPANGRNRADTSMLQNGISEGADAVEARSAGLGNRAEGDGDPSTYGALEMDLFAPLIQRLGGFAHQRFAVWAAHLGNLRVSVSCGLRRWVVCESGLGAEQVREYRLVQRNG